MESKSLIILNDATRMLAEVKTIDDAKQIMDMAAAAKMYAQKHKLGKEAVEYAHEIEIEAEIKLGEILLEMDKNKGAAEKKINAVDNDNRVSVPTLKDMGISKDLSSESQALASLPEEEKVKVKKGKKSKKKAVKEVRQQKQTKQKNEQSKKTENAVNAEVNPEQVETGQWWRLGGHVIYCGDTSSEEFVSRVPQSTFAFADPPYNVGVDEWDNNFKWNHDWLIGKAEIVAVTPGIVSIFNFAKTTTMPYVWSIACWINNGMTRGAMGFGNWIYTAIFSKGKIQCNSQDFLQVSINNQETSSTKHKGRKPAGLLVWLLDKFSKPGDIIMDPFLGSGTTLLAAQEMGRFCFGGEISPEYCAEIIARWEKQTGKKAVLINGENSLSA